MLASIAVLGVFAEDNAESAGQVKRRGSATSSSETQVDESWLKSLLILV